MKCKKIVVIFLTIFFCLALLSSISSIFPKINLNQEERYFLREKPKLSFTEANITSIILNEQNVTQTRTIELDYNEILNVTIVYSEVLTGNFISGASVGLDGETITVNFTENVIYEQYSVLINTVNLDIGWNNLNISAQKTNYTSINSAILVKVLDIFPNIIIHSPAVDTYWDEAPLIRVSVFDTNLDKIWYNITGVLSFNEFLQNGTAEYISNTIWESLPLGVIKINIYANDTDGNLSWEELQIVKGISTVPFDWQLVITAIIIGIISLAIITIVSVVVRQKLKQRGVRVFISHAVKDFDEYQIKRLAKYLQRQKGVFKVEYCEEGMVGNIDDWMETRVPRSQLLIIFFTENSAVSTDCIKELKLAFRHNITIMPILGNSMSWEQLKEKAKELEINISRDFGMEFNSENLKSFNKSVYDYVMKVKKSLEKEIQGKKRKHEDYV